MKYGVILLFIAVMPLQLFGRIGETREECDKRYGKVTIAPLVHEGITYLSYKVHGFSVDLNIINAKCERIKYIKQDFGNLEDNEIAALLNENGKGWEKVSPTHWKNSTASATVSGKHLVVETNAYKKHQKGTKTAGNGGN